MDINRENIDVFFQDLRARYTEGFNTPGITVLQDRAVMPVPSNSSSSKHAWINQIPQVREWVGDRTVQNIESGLLTVLNKKFESTIEMEREEIEDDEHGIYLPIARTMGENARTFPDKQVTDVILSGTTDTWADAVAVFSTAGRTYGDNTINNLTTDALSESSFETAYQTMTSYLGHNNAPLEVTPRFLLYGPSNRELAFDILVNDMRASSSAAIQNRNKGLVEPIMSQRLVGSNSAKWALLGEVSGIWGLAWQQRVAAEFQTSRLDINSDFVFETDKFQFGTRQRGQAFVALPHLVYYGNA